MPVYGPRSFPGDGAGTPDSIPGYPLSDQESSCPAPLARIGITPQPHRIMADVRRGRYGSCVHTGGISYIPKRELFNTERSHINDQDANLIWKNIFNCGNYILFFPEIRVFCELPIISQYMSLSVFKVHNDKMTRRCCHLPSCTIASTLPALVQFHNAQINTSRFYLHFHPTVSLKLTELYTKKSY